MSLNALHSKLFRFASWVVMAALIVTSLPAGDLMAAALAQEKKVPEAKYPPPPPNVKVNRTVPKVTPVSAFPVFSEPPTDAEITRARVFEEPLVPMGGTATVDENRALSAALLAYLKKGVTEDLSQVEAFLDQYPNSAWRVSLLTAWESFTGVPSISRAP